jgi:hypothetical protein
MAMLKQKYMGIKKSELGVFLNIIVIYKTQYKRCDTVYVYND